MDLRRSAAITLMRFGSGPDSFVWPVRWYRTSKPPLKVPHVYGSSIWEASRGRPWWDTGVAGDVYGQPMHWTNGAAPVPALTCVGPQGSASAWLGSLGGPLYAVEGYPGWDQAGGVKVGGTGIWPSAGRAHSTGYDPGYD